MELKEGDVKALAKGVRVQPRKVRILADQVRGKSAAHAIHLLRYHSSKGARELRKVLVSAVANAQENKNLSPETLEIATIMVDEGPRLKRLRARAMGRANRIIKKSSHITVVVREAEGGGVVKPHGTKPKPRPKFAPAAKPKKAKAEEPKVQAVEAVEETVAVEEAAAEVESNETPAVETEEAPAAGDESAEEVIESAAATEGAEDAASEEAEVSEEPEAKVEEAEASPEAETEEAEAPKEQD